MNERRPKMLSIASRGARFQFLIGVALVSVLPVLALVYLRVASEAGALWGGEQLAVVAALALAAAGGYLILRKYPINIVRLRNYLEGMVHGEMPDQVTLLKGEDDITAVEKFLNIIVRQLRQRLEAERGEKENLQRQLFQAQKMESLGVMAAGVAHDFNNYLTGILGNADLALQMGGVNEVGREALEDIRQMAQRASELTRTMLAYSGRAKFRVEPVDLGALVRDLMGLLRASVGRTVELRAEAEAQGVTVQGDPAQLRQLVMNLVINASEAIGERPGVVTVRVRPFHQEGCQPSETYVEGRLPEGDYALLEVEDNGCGMTPDVVARIFDPFFTTKPDGRGLGLAVVLGILRAHGGYVNVRSAPGRGTTFQVYLPLAGQAPAS